MNRNELNNLMYRRTGGIVQSGPFQNLKMNDNQGGCLGNKLLGSYESQLYQLIEEIILKKPDLVINIGCGEGYYGVGLAFRMPDVKHILIDTADHELVEAVKNGETNNLTNIEYWKEGPIDKLRELVAQSNTPVFIVDVEGYEMSLLNMETFPELSKTTILVECHDFHGIPITATLTERFNLTHTIINILDVEKTCSSRHVNDLNEQDKKELLHEGRPVIMNWLYMVPQQ